MWHNCVVAINWTFLLLTFFEVDGILFDLGCSSMQFEDSKRGFGLSKDGPLDMRMDGNRFPDQPTAAQVLEHIEEEDLARVLKVNFGFFT